MTTDLFQAIADDISLVEDALIAIGYEKEDDGVLFFPDKTKPLPVNAHADMLPDFTGGDSTKADMALIAEAYQLYETMFYLTLSPVLLQYVERSKHIRGPFAKRSQFVTVPWIKCSLVITDYATNKTIDKVFEETLPVHFKELSIKPFCDEEGSWAGTRYLKYERNQKGDGEDKGMILSFFLNPSYPDGYFGNNVI